MNIGEKVIDSIRLYLKSVDDRAARFFKEVDNWLQLTLFEPSLEHTLTEKNGRGPHGYGDPRDPSIREEEHYLFPRMVWKKIRYEKCSDVTEKYYSCLHRMYSGDSDIDCKKEETEMFACKALYYSPEKIDEVEKECIIDYVQLRSKFRETGSEDDLWQLKMLMLEPAYNELYLAYKRGASEEELRKLKPPQPETRIF